MKCLQCIRLDLQSHRDHAKVGYGRCALETMTGVFVSWRAESDCKDFAEAPADVIEQRIAWTLRKKNEK